MYQTKTKSFNAAFVTELFKRAADDSVHRKRVIPTQWMLNMAHVGLQITQNWVVDCMLFLGMYINKAVGILPGDIFGACRPVT